MALNISELKNWVGENRIKEVFEVLMGGIEEIAPSDLADQLIQLKARWSRFEDDRVRGLQTSEHLGLEGRRIDDALFHLLNKLEKERDSPGEEMVDPDQLHLECKTNKGKENLAFSQGETMRLYVKVNKPCFMRVTYRLADGRLVLFKDSFQIPPSKVGTFFEIGDGFNPSPPFGKEQVFFHAKTGPLDQLMLKQTADGYKLIQEPKHRTERGFLPKVYEAESSLEFYTK